MPLPLWVDGLLCWINKALRARIPLWLPAHRAMAGHGGRGRFVPQAARTVFKHSSVQNGSLRQRLQT